MKTQMKFIAAMVLVMTSLTINCFAQKGTIKIFSEIKGISIYLDEELKGTDIITLDSVEAGSHYLKITKEDVILFGELITVNAKSISTILVKDSKEVQEKLLASKYKEQQEYKSKKLDVLLSTRYVTETTGKSNSIYFPGYYSVTGASVNNSVSVTTSITDWFFVKGQSKITEYEFAGLVNNQHVINLYDDYNKRQTKANNTMLGIGTGIGLAGFSCLITGLLNKNGNVISKDANIYLIVFGGLAELLGYGIVSAGDNVTPMPRQYTLENAINAANLYNQNLKKELDLPEYFEP